eukprot:1146574-Pelagomonas_calceolata.AAC.7
MILQLDDTTSSVQQELCLRCRMQDDATRGADSCNGAGPAAGHLCFPGRAQSSSRGTPMFSR